MTLKEHATSYVFLNTFFKTHRRDNSKFGGEHHIIKPRKNLQSHCFVLIFRILLYFKNTQTQNVKLWLI